MAAQILKEFRVMIKLKAIWDKYFVGIIIGTVGTVLGGLVLAIDGLWDKIVSIAILFYAYQADYLYIRRVWVYTLLIVSILLTFNLAYRFFNNKKIKPWEKLSSMDSGNIRWRWDNYGFEHVKNIRAFCMKCDYELQVKYSHGDVTLSCFMCGLDAMEINGSYSDVVEVIENIIKREHRKLMKK